MNRRERDILIQQLLDGEIAEEDFESLQDVLLKDPEARKRLYEYVGLHQALSFSPSAAHTPRRELGSSLRIAQQRRVIRQTVALAAAAVVIVAVALQLIITPPVEPAVTLRTAPGSAFSITHATHPDGKEPAPGTLEVGSSLVLERGTAELTLGPAVTAIVRAPARFVVHAADRVFLARGTSWFRVEKEGRGFQVVSHDLEVIDLGTEFGVIASDDAPDEVHCFEGKVIARALGLRAEEKALVKDEAYQRDPIGRLQPVEPKPEEFLRSLPTGPTFLYWSFDGAGAGGFPSEGGHPAAGRAATEFAPTDRAGSPDPVAGRFGKALRFDGNEDHLLTAWPGILGDAPRSIAVWVRIPPDEESDSDILSWGTRLPTREKSNLKFKLGLSQVEGTVPVVSFGGTRYYAVDAKVADGRWHHLACTYRGGPLGKEDPPVSFYFDGKPSELTFEDGPDSSDTEGRFPVDTVMRTPLAIGTSLPVSGDLPVADKFRFRGDMDELYIFEFPISGEAVGRLFRENRAP